MQQAEKPFAKEEQGGGLGRRLERMWRESGQAGGQLMEPKGREWVWAGVEDAEWKRSEVDSDVCPEQTGERCPSLRVKRWEETVWGRKKEECKITKIKAVTKGQTLFLPSFLLLPSLPYYYYCLITCVNIQFECSTYGGQKREPDPQELELQVMWMLGIELWLSGRAVYSPNLGAISPTLCTIFWLTRIECPGANVSGSQCFQLWIFRSMSFQDFIIYCVCVRACMHVHVCACMCTQARV